jgi:hypothetical protein
VLISARIFHNYAGPNYTVVHKTWISSIEIMYGKRSSKIMLLLFCFVECKRRKW